VALARIELGAVAIFAWQLLGSDKAMSFSSPSFSSELLRMKHKRSSFHSVPRGLHFH
jgi:hypothetical protein